jgi:hypothetical protein
VDCLHLQNMNSEREQRCNSDEISVATPMQFRLS